MYTALLAHKNMILLEVVRICYRHSMPPLSKVEQMLVNLDHVIRIEDSRLDISKEAALTYSMLPILTHKVHLIDGTILHIERK